MVVKDLPRNAGQATLKKYLEKSNVLSAWEKSAWAQKLQQRQIRAGLTDFDRFKLNKLKNQVRMILTMERGERQKKRIRMLLNI